ncbi:MAG: hypothetical protein ABIG63_10075 [Chloroflexota bacterium]
MRGADPHPCAFNYRAPPAQVLVIQAGHARGGGWGRLTLAVGADRFASASQIGTNGAADVPSAVVPCSLRSRAAQHADGTDPHSKTSFFRFRKLIRRPVRLLQP